MHKFMNLIGLATVLITSFTLAGCNTMSGLGKDVERGGERVQDAAKPKEGTPQQTR
jgi:entericidin B